MWNAVQFTCAIVMQFLFILWVWSHGRDSLEVPRAKRLMM